jgi:hypothetical protein
MQRVLRGMTIALVASFLAWQGAPAQTTTSQSSPLNVLLTTDRFAYQPGEEIRFTLRIQNVSGQTIAVSFATSQRFDVIIRSDVTIVDRWSNGRSFAQSRGEQTWRPGETITYADSWLPASDILPGTVDAGPRRLTRGLFQLYAEVTGIAVQPSSAPVPVVIGTPIALDAGCTELSETVTLEVPADTVARTVEPQAALKALWQETAGNGAYAAYSPRLSAISNLRNLRTREPITVCVDQPAEITLP